MRFVTLAIVIHTLTTLAWSQPLETNNPKFQKRAANYNERSGGSSMLVMQNGKIVFERYAEGESARSAFLLASGTKSFSGVLALAAQEDGLLDLDEPVSLTLREWQNKSRAKDVTLRQLLHLESGVRTGGEMGLLPTYAKAIEAPFVDSPGQRFQYGGVPFQIFGEVLRRKLKPQGLSVEKYLHQRLLSPLGIEPKSWRKGPDGNIQLPSGARLTARDWAKFGECVRLEGQGLLKPESMKELLASHPSNPSYGLTWWLIRKMSTVQLEKVPQIGRALPYIWGKPYVPRDLVLAAGAGRQRLYISKSLKLVIVRQSDNVLQTLGGQPTLFRDDEFLSLLFTGKSAGYSISESKAHPPSDTSAKASFLLRRFDKNGNGKVEVQELPSRLQDRFTWLDSNGDGALGEDEIERAIRWREER